MGEGVGGWDVYDEESSLHLNDDDSKLFSLYLLVYYFPGSLRLSFAAFLKITYLAWYYFLMW